MNRRQVLGGVSAILLGSSAGCLRITTPDSGPDSIHLESGVWMPSEDEPVPDTLLFEDEPSAVENVVGSAADEYEAFVRDTDFGNSYLVLLQNITAAEGAKLTIRGTERNEDRLEIDIDVWLPIDIGPSNDGMHPNAIATRRPRDERGIPGTLSRNVQRPEDRSLLESFSVRIDQAL